MSCIQKHLSGWKDWCNFCALHYIYRAHNLQSWLVVYDAIWLEMLKVVISFFNYTLLWAWQIECFQCLCFAKISHSTLSYWGLNPGTSRTRSQHSTFRLSRRRHIDKGHCLPSCDIASSVNHLKCLHYMICTSDQGLFWSDDNKTSNLYCKCYLHDGRPPHIVQYDQAQSLDLLVYAVTAPAHLVMTSLLTVVPKC